MISEESLNKCIDKLATINANSDDAKIKQLTVEVGYILKEELDLVKAWNSQFDGKKIQQIDAQKLIQDNTQLAHENAKLQKINVELTKMIDLKIPTFENVIGNINKKLNNINQLL